MENIAETENLVKTYGQKTVVDHVTLHVPRGKIYGLLGRNGAGKTTLMSMLLHLTRPDSGQIRLFGKDYRTFQKENYARIGSMIETPGFYRNLTGPENLEILARLRGCRQSGVIQKALQKVGLEQETEKYFENYSLGMKQRLGIAAALMHEPELLILDEPVNGLDPVGIASFRKELHNLCRQKGMTILISSHILSEIEQLADVIGVMKEGKLIREVTMAQLREEAPEYLELEVSDTENAGTIIKKHYSDTAYKVMDKKIRVYGHPAESGEINTLLVKNGITVHQIYKKEENLEKIFAELTGGEQNA